MNTYDYGLIRRLREEGRSRQEIADYLDCSLRTVGRALRDQNPSVDYIERDPAELDKEDDAKARSDDSEVHYTYFAGAGHITILTDSGQSVTIAQSEIEADMLLNAMSTNSQEALGWLFQEYSPQAKLESFYHGALSIEGGDVRYVDPASGQEISIPSGLHDRLGFLMFDGDKEGLHNLARFIERLFQNPSLRSVVELYDFMEAADIKIDEDGYAICYKRVNNDYTDCHTGTFDNSPGKVVSMPRFQVNTDANQTCSNGLHVCSKAYLPHYSGSRVVQVRVDPADFVSIPMDYYSNDGGEVKAKARVCKYLVLADVTSDIGGL